MGKHGRNPRAWTTMLGLVSVGLVLAAVIALIIVNPRLRHRAGIRIEVTSHDPFATAKSTTINR